MPKKKVGVALCTTMVAKANCLSALLLCLVFLRSPCTLRHAAQRMIGLLKNKQTNEKQKLRFMKRVNIM